VPQLFWEDFAEGSVAEYGPRLVLADEIVAFAAEFDPQPMHLDDNAARATMLGGLGASGWHTCALMMRIIVDGFIGRSASMGSPGVEEAKWLRPVRPGDHLTVRATVLEKRASRSRPGMGTVKFLFEVVNQAGDVVMALITPLMIGRRVAADAVSDDQAAVGAT
jgi:acyl dehydratase